MSILPIGRRVLLSGLAMLAWGPARSAERERILVRDLYGNAGAFSTRAEALNGKSVRIPGFMAPPLKAEADFFVLTKMPMSVCPFCDKEADWPRDIVLVRLRRKQGWVDFNLPIEVDGKLELGTEVDSETGFVSRVRLTDAVFQRV